LAPGVVVLAAIAAVAVLGVSGDSATTTTTTTTTTIPDEAASPIPDVVELGNDRIDPDIEWAPWLPESGSILSIGVVGSTVTAVGSDAARAAIWTLDPTGERRSLPGVDPGDWEASQVSVLAPNADGGAVALGRAVGDLFGVPMWEATSPDQWTYLGEEDGLAGIEVADAAWGPAGLIVLGNQVSDDGLSASQGIWEADESGVWHSVPLPIDPRAGFRFFSITGAEDGYAIGGHFVSAVEPDRRDFRPVVLTSGDGVTWDAVGAADSALLPFDEGGAIIDIVGSSDGLTAVGYVNRGNAYDAAVWRSPDRATWYRVGIDDPAFDLAPIEIEVQAIQTGDEGAAASLVIGGDGVQVEVGTRIRGLGFDAEVTAILPDRVVLDVAGETERITAGSTASFERNSSLYGIAVSGTRWVAVGSVGAVPAAWWSIDGGASWQMSALPVQLPDQVSNVRGIAIGVAMVGIDVVVVSRGGDAGTQISHGVWRHVGRDADVFAADAIGRVPQFLAALFTNGIWPTASLSSDLAESAEFSLPTLGGIALDWRDEATGEVDQAAVADTASYLGALGAEVEVDGCAVLPVPDGAETATVTCSYRASSHLLSLLGIEEETGTVTAQVGLDGIRSLATRGAESTDAWLTLAEWAADTDRDAFVATVGSFDPNGRWRLVPTIDAAAAQTHLDLAERFPGTAISLGDDSMVETAAGTIAYRWADPPDVAGPLMWVGDRFVLAGQTTTEPLAVWESSDGLAWTQGTVPEGATWIDFMVDIDGSRVAAGRRGETPAVWVESAGTWRAVDGFTPPDEAGFGTALFGTLVVYRGDAYMTVLEPGDDGGAAVELWRIGPDRSATVVDLSAAISGLQLTDRGLLVSDDGLFYVTGSTASTTSIWRSGDGTHWNELASGLDFGTANGVVLLDIETTDQGFLAVADPIDASWATIGGGRSGHIWLSADGRRWTPAFGTAGSLVTASAVAIGPLGIVTARDSVIDQGNAWMRVSADGTGWDLVGSLIGIDNGAGRAFVTPVVGDDTVIFLVGTTGDAIRRPLSRMLVMQVPER
jgi:hypothetical protein